MLAPGRCDGCGDLAGTLNEDAHCLRCEAERIEADTHRAYAATETILAAIEGAVDRGFVHPHDLLRDVDEHLSGLSAKVASAATLNARRHRNLEARTVRTSPRTRTTHDEGKS